MLVGQSILYFYIISLLKDTLPNENIETKKCSLPLGLLWG